MSKRRTSLPNRLLALILFALSVLALLFPLGTFWLKSFIFALLFAGGVMCLNQKPKNKRPPLSTEAKSAPRPNASGSSKTSAPRSQNAPSPMRDTYRRK